MNIQQAATPQKKFQVKNSYTPIGVKAEKFAVNGEVSYALCGRTKLLSFANITSFTLVKNQMIMFISPITILSFDFSAAPDQIAVMDHIPNLPNSYCYAFYDNLLFVISLQANYSAETLIVFNIETRQVIFTQEISKNRFFTDSSCHYPLSHIKIAKKGDCFVIYAYNFNIQHLCVMWRSLDGQ